MLQAAAEPVKEIIDGVLYTMPRPRPRHQRIGYKILTPWASALLAIDLVRRREPFQLRQAVGNTARGGDGSRKLES